MTINQLAILLRQTPTTIQRRISEGDIPSKMIYRPNAWGGNKYREIPDEWVRDLLDDKVYDIR